MGSLKVQKYVSEQMEGRMDSKAGSKREHLRENSKEEYL
jgi:hypothetical protein